MDIVSQKFAVPLVLISWRDDFRDEAGLYQEYQVFLLSSLY